MSSLSPSASWMTTTPGQGGRVAGSAAYARTRPGTASKVTSGIGGAYVTRWGEEDAVVGGALDGRAASSPPREEDAVVGRDPRRAGGVIAASKSEDAVVGGTLDGRAASSPPREGGRRRGRDPRRAGDVIAASRRRTPPRPGPGGAAMKRGIAVPITLPGVGAGP